MNQDYGIYILAGGKSTRFGSDKARADVHGRAMILHVCDRLTELQMPVTVIASAPDEYSDLHLRTIADRIPGNGPMSGLHAALHDCPAPWVLLVSCDCIGFKSAWAQSLASARNDDTDAVAFRHDYWEPLPGFYRKTLGQEVQARIERNALTMRRLLDDIRANPVPLPADWQGVVQVNTPDDLSQYLAQPDPS